jgi:hypothetical protein
MTTLRDSLNRRCGATCPEGAHLGTEGEGTVRQPWKGFVRF